VFFVQEKTPNHQLAMIYGIRFKGFLAKQWIVFSLCQVNSPFFAVFTFFAVFIVFCHFCCFLPFLNGATTDAVTFVQVHSVNYLNF